MRRQRGPSRPGDNGEGTTEYLIILALMAIAAIGAFHYLLWGDTRQPPAALTTEATGRPAGQDTAGVAAKAAEKKAMGHAPGAGPGSPDK